MRPLAGYLALCSLFLASGAAAQNPPEVVHLPAEPLLQEFRPVSRAIRLPAEITPQHGIYVQARLNGSAPLWFLLDSAGGSPLILDQKKAIDMRLPVDGRGVGIGAGENPFTVTYSQGVSVSLEGVELNDQTVAATSLETLRRYAGRDLDGILGFQLFSRYVVEVHYATGTVNLYEPQNYQYTGSGQILPATLEGKHFCVRVRISLDGSEPLDARLLVDTGAGQILTTLNSPYVDSHRLLSPSWNRAASRVQVGLGGETRVFAAHARALELGRFTFHDLTVELSRDTKGLMASADFDGILGGEMLRRFKVIFDYSRRRIIFEPNPQLAGL